MHVVTSRTPLASGYSEAMFYVQSRAAAHANKARRGINLESLTEDVYTELGVPFRRNYPFLSSL